MILSSPLRVPLLLSDNDVPLPQHLPLQHARLALELEHDGQDALQDAEAVQDLLGRVALRSAAGALDERRREGGDVARGRGGERVVRDEVEQPGGYHADERGDVLGRVDQRSANFSRMRYRRRQHGVFVKDVIKLTILWRNEREYVRGRVEEDGILFGKRSGYQWGMKHTNFGRTWSQ